MPGGQILQNGQKKKATAKAISDNICFQYAAIFGLIHEEIGKNLQGIYYTWKKIKYTSGNMKLGRV